MPASCRVMAVFQGASLLPEDRYINVFHFHEEGVESFPVYALECNTAVGEFYTDDWGEGPLGSLLSPYIARPFQTLAYDLTVPAGEREPVVSDHTLGSALGDGMPEEVAICLTNHGAPPITPRRRGRLYFGPLSTACVNMGDASNPARVEAGANSVVLRLCEAAEGLANRIEVTWCVRSSVPTENFVPIVGGWVDNALDTQRRRGADPTARTLWAEV